MPTTHHPAVLTDVSFSWPDGTPALRNISATFGTGRTGLIGANGSGKTTLLKLIAGLLEPTSGTVTVNGQLGYLPQQLTLEHHATVADLLRIRTRLDALRAIESGSADPRDFETLADDWEVEARADAALAGLGLHPLGMDRLVGTLSGGETILTALAGLQLGGDDVVLLDEPTNNLDRDARRQFHEAISRWQGTLIVVSHDATLLNLMDNTAELWEGALSMFGGPYNAYREHLATEQAAAAQALRTAEQKLKIEQRQRTEAQTKLARRERYARNDAANKRKPKIVMNHRATEAQVSAGTLRGQLDQKVEAAQSTVDAQAARVRDETGIRIELPDPDVHSGRRLAELRDA